MGCDVVLCVSMMIWLVCYVGCLCMWFVIDGWCGLFKYVYMVTVCVVWCSFVERSVVLCHIVMQ